MGHEAFGVDLAALGQAEQGVRDAVAELGSMAGWGNSELGAEGQGLVQGIMSSAPSVGHDKLAAALLAFADKWEWGVRFLVDDGVDTADAMRDTRAWYEKVDEEAVSLLKQGMHAAIGNPMEDDAAWADKSWTDIAKESLPDWSPDSFEQANQRTTQRAEAVTGWDLDGDGKAGQPGGGQ